MYLIGDTVGDIIEAKKAGIKSTAVTWGFQDRDRLLAMGPDFIVDTPEDINVFISKSF